MLVAYAIIKSPKQRLETYCFCSVSYYYFYFIVLLRDVFHIGLVIGLRPAVLARGAAERQYSRPRTYN